MRCAGSSSTGTGSRSRRSRAPSQHEAALARLLESGAAYRDTATAKEVEAWKAEHGADRGYRGEPVEDPGAAIRLRVPDEGATVVEDLIRGPVSFPNRSYDDFVIARGDGSVLYNFAVAVDDAEMGITDVVRGDDHLSNTPKQLLVLDALGHDHPRYAHLPLLHGPDGRKLSKRHGAASVQELRDGRLPAGRGPQLPGAARLGRRRRRDPDSRPRSWSSASGSRTSAAPPRSSTRRSCAGSTAATCASCRSTSTRRRWPRIPGGEADERLRAACEIAQDKAQTLDEVWPLIAFLFEPPVEDEKAWRKVMKDGTLPLLEAAREALAARPGFDAGDGRGGAVAAPRDARGQAGQALPADPGRDHRDHASHRASSSRWPCSAREVSLDRIEAANRRLRRQWPIAGLRPSISDKPE